TGSAATAAIRPLDGSPPGAPPRIGAGPFAVQLDKRVRSSKTSSRRLPRRLRGGWQERPACKPRPGVTHRTQSQTEKPDQDRNIAFSFAVHPATARAPSRKPWLADPKRSSRWQRGHAATGQVLTTVNTESAGSGSQRTTVCSGRVFDF